MVYPMKSPAKSSSNGKSSKSNNTRTNAIYDEESPLIPASSSTASTNGSTYNMGRPQQEEGEDGSASFAQASALPLHSVRPLPGMQIRCHRLLENGTVHVCTQGDVFSKKSKTKTAKSNQFWMDIDAEPEHLQELRHWFATKLPKLPSFVMDMLAEPPDQWASQVLPLPQSAVLLMLRILPKTQQEDYGHHVQDNPHMAHLAALQLPHVLITFTSCARREMGDLYTPALQRMQQRMDAESSHHSHPFLVAWLRFHLDRTATCARSLRRIVLQLDAAMDQEVTSVSLVEVIELKDELLRLLSVAEEQTACMEELLSHGSATAISNGSRTSTTMPLSGSNSYPSLSLPGGASSSLSTLLATASATERMSLRLEKHIFDLRHRCEGHRHEQMNRRLSVLTVCSAVFLPLTLFTGIWGMNFEHMPELQNEYSYPLALVFMVGVAVMMIAYFRRAGWFD